MSDLSLSVVNAAERLDRVAFNPMVEWTDHVVEVGVYACPHCQMAIRINIGTLRQFERGRVSPLGSDWYRRCDAVRPIGTLEWATDFRCARCRGSVRIVYFMLTPPLEAGTFLWGFQRGRASPLVKGGVKTPPARI